MKKDILILHGPNLNLLGQREEKWYGTASFDTYFESLQTQFPDLQLHYFQSNHEGALLDKLHAVGFSYAGIVFNAGAYTHTSVALGDALAAIQTPVIEVHISNLAQREKFRQHSYLTPHCAGSIVGFGFQGYALALHYFNTLPLESEN